MLLLYYIFILKKNQIKRYFHIKKKSDYDLLRIIQICSEDIERIWVRKRYDGRHNIKRRGLLNEYDRIVG